MDGDSVVYIPNAAGAEKAELLRAAVALLAPIQWDEPFGLSVVEAMVCGTPAISMGRGAAAELVEEGVTGFLTDDVDGMVEAIARCAEIDRVRCADVARRRFHPATMAAGPLSVYGRVVGIGGQA